MSTFSAAAKLIAVVLLASASLVAVPALAWAQAPVTSFDQVPTRVKVGDTVFVTDATGREVKGKVLGLSAASLALQADGRRQEFPAPQVSTLTWQDRDSLHNGALFGLAAGVGAGIGILVYGAQDPGDGSAGIAVAVVAGLGGVGAGIGALIDALIPGRKILVYRAASLPSAARISIAPILTPTRQGVAVRVSF